MIYYILFLLVSFIYPLSDGWHNYSHLNWQTFETDNFIIHFHDGTKRSAGETAKVAEEIHEKITSFYDFVPKNKTTIIIEDVEDYSNGGAYFFDNKIVISGKPMDYDLRGAHRWIQDVITHEYTHIVQLGAAMKYSRNFPGTYLQLLDYEDEKREDVLYGFPNKIISYPLPNTTVPPWFAEGTAQYMYKGANYDYWDSIRDMILRERVLNDDLLSLNEMSIFGKTGIGNESTYNQGFSLVKFIAYKYGEDKLKDITYQLSRSFTFSIDKAIENTLGVSAEHLYNEWKSELQFIYSNQVKSIDKNNVNYTIIEGEGTTNMHPVWSPDGTKFLFLSNKENDYFGQTDLFLYDLSDSTSTKIKSGVKSAPTWVNESEIIYSRRSKRDKFGQRFFDLYSYSIDEEEEIQITNGLRLFSPVYDVSNKKIYAINTYDGSCNIMEGDYDPDTFLNEKKSFDNLGISWGTILAGPIGNYIENLINDNKEILDKGGFDQSTTYNDGMQLFSLSLYDSMILFDGVINHERNIYFLNLDTKEIGVYESDLWDSRDPIFNDETFIHSNDKHGIFNLYLKSGNNEGFLTNVTGGAFMPDVHNNGQILFSLYDNGAYKIAILNNNDFMNNDDVGIDNLDGNRSDFNNDINSKSFYARPTSKLINSSLFSEIKDYEIDTSGPFVMPRIMVDYETIKAGLYLYDNDFLNKLSVLFGASLNKDKDVDSFLLFENNDYNLGYFFNFYFITRNISKKHPYINPLGQQIESINYYIDYVYHLFSMDLGYKYAYRNHKFMFYSTASQYRQFYNVRKEQITQLNVDNQYGDGAHNYFRGFSYTLDYEYDARKPHYLSNMIPSSGFKIKSKVSYEQNSIFEEFRANENLGSIKEYLAEHNTARYQVEFEKHWKTKNIILFDNSYEYLTISNNIKYYDLSKRSVDDFLYFFGGGLTGMKGYTFYEPTLQGPNFMLLTNKVTTPIFKEKAFKAGFVHLNSMSFSIVHQLGKAKSGKIMVYSGDYSLIDSSPYAHLLTQEVENYLLGIVSEEDNPNCYGAVDALDKDNCIPDELEPYIYPNIYFSDEYDSWNNPSFSNSSNKSIKDLKNMYDKFKYSVGFEIKLYGFSFYSYPTALTYEFHKPINDDWNSKGRHYFKLLFDFN